MQNYKLTTILLLGSLVAFQAEAANLYKYKDDTGRQITGTSVPAEFVKNGYQVLNERGQVIEVVARTLSSEELEAQEEEVKEQRLAEAARLKQEEDDRMLLRLYRAPEEVIRRRDSTVEELDSQLSVLNALFADAEEKLIELQKRVETNEAAGNPVPANLVSQIEDAMGERDRLNRQMLRIETEKQDAIDTAESNINRLKELLNLE